MCMNLCLCECLCALVRVCVSEHSLISVLFVTCFFLKSCMSNLSFLFSSVSDSPQVPDGKWSVSYCHQGPPLIQVEHSVLLVEDLKRGKRNGCNSAVSAPSHTTWTALTGRGHVYESHPHRYTHTHTPAGPHTYTHTRLTHKHLK